MELQVKDNIQVEINDDILKFLTPQDNVMLSEFSNSDRNYMMYLLRQYYLGLRNTIGVSKDITFGLELEFDEVKDTDIIDCELYNDSTLKDWCMVPDGSLPNGAEINSPVLRDSEDTWIDLSRVCDLIDEYAYISDNVGGHIHIGTQILGNNPKYWANFIKLWVTYENIIFRFLYGEFASPRSIMANQAKPILLDFIKRIEDIDKKAKNVNASHLFRLLDYGDENIKVRRKKSVNFTNVSRLQPYEYNMEKNMNTIEFRSPNGTFDPVIWQNNVSFLVKLMLYCKSDRFNLDIVERRRKEIENGIVSPVLNSCLSYDVERNNKKLVDMYSRVYVEQAIELADMIFDNNLDKIYFLRQYIKQYEVTSQSLVRSKKFTNYVNARGRI